MAPLLLSDGRERFTGVHSTVIEEADMAVDRVTGLEQRMAQLEKQVGELWEVVSQS